MASATASVRRSFTVSAAPEVVWDELSAVTEWPRWAAHIRSVTVTPPGPLGPTSRGTFRLAGGPGARFAMTAFDAPHGWSWRGRFLWFTVDYDHRIAGGEAGPTEVTFVVTARGPLASTVGAAFARRYAGSLDRAIPALVALLVGPGATVDGAPRRAGGGSG
jgi:hypothetical protein